MRPRVLYVTHRVPFPPDRGDRIRTWNILKFLAKRADVDLACLAEEPVSADTRRTLEEMTVQLALVPHSACSRYAAGALSMICGRTATEGLFFSFHLRRILQQWSRQQRYDALLASSSGVARYVLPPVVRSTGHVWIDLIDVDSRKWVDYASASRFPVSAVYNCEGRRLQFLEKRLNETENVDRLLVVTTAERELFGTFCSNERVQVVSNGVDAEYFAPSHTLAENHSCVFVGVMDYRPNVDGVCWFVQDVWPRLKQKYPRAFFNIVGRSPVPEVCALESVDGVHVAGQVDDVRPWLYQARCAVAPMRIARGVPNKVLEAMSCGRPVVCSPSPLKGLRVESGLHVLSARSADEWIRQIGSVFDDDCRAVELGVAASAWVQTNHCWEDCLEPLNAFLERRKSTFLSGMDVLP